MRRGSFIPKVGPFLLCLIAAVLPLMIFRQLWLSARARLEPRSDGDTSQVPELEPASAARVPVTPEQIAAAASARGLEIPPACSQGVTANLELLASHAENLRGDPAYERP